ncbi:hypothetical protein GAYE_SCF41G5467 [Galdieria yellowstonensis]|uniref:tRNA-binding domain-containing protein n=1 Tax=Galdieria yellowstonensis TaxID=3028027 RepID=A0AAV9IJP8_9RHOD|nr:hypothetical protein GAYE_SCF41G5467 [Galdieria yellowstonensis]
MPTMFVVTHWLPKLFEESLQRRNVCSPMKLKKKLYFCKGSYSCQRILATMEQTSTTELRPQVNWLENRWVWPGTTGKCDATVDDKGRVWLKFSPVEDSCCYKVHYGPLELFPSWRTTSRNQIRIDSWKPEQVYRVQIYSVKGDLTKEQLIFQGKLSWKATTTTVEQQVPFQDASVLELRVGKILSCKKHPNADTLLVEEIDIGEDSPRTIVSGLVKYYQPEELISRKVVVVCNLKPKKMRGVESKGMLLCGSTKDKSKVEPLSPPENAQIGELVSFQGCDMKPTESGNQASKSFERVVAFLKTDSKGIALLENRQLLTSQGPCSCSIVDGNVS